MHCAEKLGVKTQISTELMEITKDKIFVDGGVEDKEIARDMVVLFLGVRTDSVLIDSFKEACDNVLVVGGANKSGRVSNAICSAFEQTYFFK
ncbi:hypothetical protein [Tannockella kyphosi]|uniref:hypothetical protein n=1 Tax=Tannockella kyphosi TaxID=2899121 RepID=UPI0020123732|nr:hypothetical protein [Tannockella kyphosi]